MLQQYLKSIDARLRSRNSTVFVKSETASYKGILILLPLPPPIRESWSCFLCLLLSGNPGPASSAPSYQGILVLLPLPPPIRESWSCFLFPLLSENPSPASSSPSYQGVLVLLPLPPLIRES